MADRIVAKCIKLYARTRSKRWLMRYVDRIDNSKYEVTNLLMDVIEPEIRRIFFPDLTVDGFLDEVMTKCRAVEKPGVLISNIWYKLDYELFFSFEEYTEFGERFQEEVSKLPNPPRKEDWEDLDEELMK